MLFLFILLPRSIRSRRIRNRISTRTRTLRIRIRRLPRRSARERLRWLLRLVLSSHFWCRTERFSCLLLLQLLPEF